MQVCGVSAYRDRASANLLETRCLREILTFEDQGSRGRVIAMRRALCERDSLPFWGGSISIRGHRGFISSRRKAMYAERQDSAKPRFGVPVDLGIEAQREALLHINGRPRSGGDVLFVNISSTQCLNERDQRSEGPCIVGKTWKCGDNDKLLRKTTIPS